MPEVDAMPRIGPSTSRHHGRPVSEPNLSRFLWSIAELLRGDYKPSEYGKVVLPFTVLRRLDCLLEATKPAVLAKLERQTKAGTPPEPILLKKSGQAFYNMSPNSLPALAAEPNHLRKNLLDYVQAFSPDVRDLFEKFGFRTQVDRLHRSRLLPQVVRKFAAIDLHPKTVSSAQMGSAFEELLRKFAESSSDMAGEHFTPREVVELMVQVVIIDDEELLKRPKAVHSLYDPAAGTGGMLSAAADHVARAHPHARLVLHGQELNAESYALCKADLLIRGQDVGNLALGNTLANDAFRGKHFDYLLSNPPFGMDWRKIENEVRREAERAPQGRFGPGLPRISDGSLLFLLQLVSKMKPTEDGGSRAGIILHGSALFGGGAGSGESEIRRHVLENDLVEAVIALPAELFHNTPISTYLWILSNRKPERRQGKVQLIDAGRGRPERCDANARSQPKRPAHRFGTGRSRGPVSCQRSGKHQHASSHLGCGRGHR
jgi:type I restriction enzyme M protein